MCSICGEVNFIDECDDRLEIVKKMNRVQSHRGPDDSDIFNEKYLIPNLRLIKPPIAQSLSDIGYKKIIKEGYTPCKACRP